MNFSAQVAARLPVRATDAACRAAEYLLSQQNAAGYWCGRLTADTTLESDFIRLQLWLHPPEGGSWNPPTRRLVDKAVGSILERQLPDGGFNTHPEGPADVSATVKAYFALKLAGLSADGAELSVARECILSLGGIQAADSYVKINLSLFGLYPREHCPSIPPEIMLLPGGFIYRMSSWSRAIAIPLSIVQSHQPMRPVPAGFDLKELFLPGEGFGFGGGNALSWRSAFLWADRLAKIWERHGVERVRRKAIRKAERWMLERTRFSDGPGAIYPSVMYAIMAMDVLGYAPDHPDRSAAQSQLDRLMIDDGERVIFQPCFSPVRDTAIAAFALGEAGLASEGALRRTAEWLVGKEVRRKGDWSVKRPNAEPSGWRLELANDFYPSIDGTAMVLLALRHARGADASTQSAAIQRAIQWLLEMQSRDGGWAAFDADINWRPAAEAAFAGHNAMLDLTCPDITGRVVEALCAFGLSGEHPAVLRGVGYLRRAQEQDGSWRGRWGVHYIYGTFLALRGLRAAGEGDREAHILRAGEWLRSVQNPDGGWGESCTSYDHGHFVWARSTPSQTAWALLGLMAGGDSHSLSVSNGIEYLLNSQRRDGSWDEDLATGTGLPVVFHVSYHLYRQSFPLLALGTFVKSNQGMSREGA